MRYTLSKISIELSNTLARASNWIQTNTNLFDFNFVGRFMFDCCMIKGEIFFPKISQFFPFVACNLSFVLCGSLFYAGIMYFFLLFSALATDSVVLDVSPTYQNTVDSMLHIFQFAQLKFFNKHWHLAKYNSCDTVTHAHLLTMRVI